MAAAARGTTRTNEDDVDNLPKRQRLAVVPAAVVEPLAQQLDGRLRAVLLLRVYSVRLKFNFKDTESAP